MCLCALRLGTPLSSSCERCERREDALFAGVKALPAEVVAEALTWLDRLVCAVLCVCLHNRFSMLSGAGDPSASHSDHGAVTNIQGTGCTFP